MKFFYVPPVICFVLKILFVAVSFSLHTESGQNISKIVWEGMNLQEKMDHECKPILY